MSLNKTKVLASAQKYVQRGAFDKAIREYQRLIEEDPKDVRTLLRIGDLHARRGDAVGAARTYDRVAQTYSEQGFYQKAVAVYKQILKVDPSQPEINQRLAELYQELGLLSNAMEQYQILAAAHERQGRAKETIAIFEKLVKLDPENVASRVKLAELYSREGRSDESVGEFEKACDQLIAQHRQDDYIKVAERLLFLDPGKLRETRRLSKIYLDRGDTKRALGKLQICFKADPRDIETLSLLAETFKALGQLAKSVSVLKELAKLYREKGLHKEHDKTWERVREIAPDDAEAMEALMAPRPAAAPAEALTKGDDVSVSALLLTEQKSSASRARRAPPPRPGSAAAPSSSAAGPAAELERRLSEVDTLIAHGLFQKAREIVDTVLGASPKHEGALRRQHDIAGRMGDNSGAAEAMLALARQSASRSPAQRELLERAFDIDPQSASVRRAFDELGLPLPSSPVGRSQKAGAASPAPARAWSSTAPPRAGAALPAAPADAEEIIIVDDEDEDGGYRDETVFSPPPAPPLRLHSPLPPADPSTRRTGSIPLTTLDVGGGLPAQASKPVAEDDDAMLDEVLQALDEQGGEPLPWDVAEADRLVDLEPPVVRRAGAVPQPPAASFPQGSPPSPPPRPASRARAAAEADRSEVPTPRDAAPKSPPAPQRVAQPPAAKAPDPLSALGDLDDLTLDTDFIRVPDLSERTMIAAAPPDVSAFLPKARTESDVSGQLEEAEFFRQQGLHEEALLILEELVRLFPARRDIAKKLAEVEAVAGPREQLPVEGAEEVVLDEQFEDISALTEAPVSPEDAETHYDLGIAYKEMGLYDDAITEFSQARRADTRELAATERIGACLVEKGAFDDAIRELKRGLSSPRLTESAAIDFYYVLGSAYEGKSDEREALYYYHRVHAAMKDYRDVAQRVQRLSPGQSGTATALPGRRT